MSGSKPVRYGAYLFRDKEPVIDELRTIIQQNNGGKLATRQLRAIELNGGPSVSCMVGWFFGKTRRPQSATVEAAGRAMGYKRQWVRMTNAESARVKPRKK